VDHPPETIVVRLKELPDGHRVVRGCTLEQLVEIARHFTHDACLALRTVGNPPLYYLRNLAWSQQQKHQIFHPKNKNLPPGPIKPI
jgi:hypothetical protein